VIAVAATAPAYAASPCDKRTNQLLDWDGANVTFQRSSDIAAKAILDPDLAGPIPVVTVDIASAYVGNMKAGSEVAGATNPNLRVATAVGGLNVSGVSLWQATTSQTPAGSADRGSYTFSFSRPVTNLRFTITDIDSQAGDFRDALTLTSGYTVTSIPATVTRATDATFGEYFIATGDSTPTDNATGNAGNLGIKYAGTISQFTITYTNSATSFDNTRDQDQTIYVSDLTFDYKPC
jgi:hypothetical protein